MLIAVFYDRKNKREVKSTDLMTINLVDNYASIDTDDRFVETGRRIIPESFEPVTHEQYLSMKKDGDYAKCFKTDLPEWDLLKKEKTPIVLYPIEIQLANIGYKSENCPSNANWDLFCKDTDLVFLRFEKPSK